MTSFLRTISPLVLCFFVLTSGAIAGVVNVGDPAPSLKGELFSGKQFDLAEHRGQVVMINFYSSYCKSCAYQIGNIDSYRESERGKQLIFIAIGVDTESDRHRVSGMLGAYNLDGMMMHDIEESGFNSSYRTPTVFVIDKSGTVRLKQRGSKMLSWFTDHIDPLIDE